MSKNIRIAGAGAVVVTTAFVAFVVAQRPEYRPREIPSTSTTSIVFNERSSGPDYDAQGTFATEKLKVTGTGSDSIVASGGMYMAGSADFANGSTLYGVTITASTNHAGNALALKAVDNVQDGASVRFLRSDGTIRWSLGNNSTVGSVTHDLYLFDNTNLNYALYLNPASTSYLRMGLTAGRIAYDDTTHTMTLNTNAVTRLTIADALITSAVALDMGTHLINNVVDPVDPQDAATKNYVDTHGGFISGLTTGVIPKATSATSIGDSKLSETAGPFLDWNSPTPSIAGTGYLTIGPSGTIVLGSSGGLPSTEITLNAITGDITSNNGSLTVFGGVTADAGKRVFDVAGAGLTSSMNTVDVATTLGSGITVNADSIQMTFCAANQIPQMNAGGTAWGCAAAASGTIGGSATSPGVIYASAANTAATDATNFTYDSTNKGIRVGSSAVTTASANDAVVVSGGGASSAAMSFWNTSASGYSQIYWSDSSITYKGALGYANASAGSTNLRQKNFFVSNGPDFVFNEAAGGTNLLTVFMTSGSAGVQLTNGSSAAVGSSGTGKIIYNNTTKTFRVSQDGGAFTSVVTGAVALNTIPKSSNGTTGALADSLLTDNGTTFAINTNKFTVTEASGNTSIAGTLGVTGDVAINTNKFTVAATTGNTLVAGTLGVTSDVAINTNKYTITASTGSAVSAGSETAALGFFDNGTAPTISSCGSSPTVTSGRGSFTITAGTGSVSSCTATFSTAFSSTPTCTATVVNSGTNQFVRFSALSSSALTVTSTFLLDSVPINIVCIGH